MAVVESLIVGKRQRGKRGKRTCDNDGEGSSFK